MTREEIERKRAELRQAEAQLRADEEAQAERDRQQEANRRQAEAYRRKEEQHKKDELNALVKQGVCDQLGIPPDLRDKVTGDTHAALLQSAREVAREYAAQIEQARQEQREVARLYRASF